MLIKVDKLGHIGRFEELRHRADRFRRLALIFARNGMGKSTICAVLRSAVAQDAKPIDERVHLGNVGSPMASLEVDGLGTVAFNNGTWNRATSPMLVFDQEFIRQNVHAAEEVTRDNKRGLFRVIIGSAGVTLAREIEALDEENRRVNATIRELESAIRAVVPVVTDIDVFEKAEVREDLAAKIEEAARNLKRAEEASEIQRRPSISVTGLEGRGEQFPALLGKTLGAGLERSRERLAEHIEKHGLDERAGRWLQYGVEHSEGPDCPFCDQPLASSDIYETLRTLFGHDYRNLAADVELARSALRPLVEIGASNLLRIIGQNRVLADYWNSVIGLPDIPSFGDEELAAMSTALNQMFEALGEKMTDLSEVVLPVAQEEWTEVVRKLETYDIAVGSANEVIARTKAGGAAPDALEAAKSQLAKLKGLEAKGQEPLNAHLATWKAAKARHEAIAKERGQKQAALRAHMGAIAEAYQNDVNKLLKRFGTNFTLCRTKASFVGGGQPNTEYCIDIDGYVIPAGESGDEPRPSFRTALSGGDKSSLALALFLVQAARRQDLQDVILVFDDPFNSQDSGRQFETAATLRRLATTAKQVVVLSHDPRFLHMLLKDAGPVEVSEHQIVLTGRWKAKVKAWSCKDEIKSDYVRRAERIREYAATQTHLQDSNGNQLASDIRIFMEEFLDQRFPGRFADGATLGQMCDAITDDPDDPLHTNRDDLRELNAFGRPDHHRGTQPPDPVELQAQCQKVVDILGDH